MKINIQQVKHDIGAAQNFRFEISPADLFQEIEHLWIGNPIIVTGKVINDGRILKVSGNIKFTAVFDCDRCLESYSTHLEIPFMEKFQENGNDINNTDDDITTYQGDEINIGELVRENIILEKPLKTVCNDACRGLCPKCGTNLNISTCACEKGVIDPRLAALQQLLNKK